VNRYSLTHLSNSALDAGMETVTARDHQSTADMPEYDDRKRYRQAGYRSMFAYCLGRMNLSDDEAGKRIHAARAARRFPAIFAAVADGRLHLTAVVMLAPHLDERAADELLAAATRKTKAEIERLLAERFPRPDVPMRIEAIGPTPPDGKHAPERVGMTEPLHLGASKDAESAEAGEARPESAQDIPATPIVAPAAPAPPARVKPLAPQRFALQVTIGQSAREKLQHAQNLLGHRVPAGDIAQVLDLALSALIEKLERSKFGATSKPRPTRAASDSRHIPAHVKRAVWNRDGGQCTFKAADGHRCEARSDLQFDHVIPVALGGRSDVDNIRLLCRAHNQLEAERTYGSDFMDSKRRAS